jgi:hypothetical protein
MRTAGLAIIAFLFATPVQPQVVNQTDLALIAKSSDGNSTTQYWAVGNPQRLFKFYSGPNQVTDINSLVLVITSVQLTPSYRRNSWHLQFDLFNTVQDPGRNLSFFQIDIAFKDQSGRVLQTFGDRGSVVRHCPTNLDVGDMGSQINFDPSLISAVTIRAHAADEQSC